MSLKRILESGERVLIRSSDGGAARPVAGALLLVFTVAWIRGIWGAELFGFQFWYATLIFLTGATLVLAVAWLWMRWKWVITDRRVLKRYGMFSSEIGEMRHETVEDVKLDGAALIIHGRDYWWKFPISPHFCRADILYDLFGPRFGDSGLTVKPLPNMLEPGETIIWRSVPLFADVLPWAILLAGPVVLVGVVIRPEFGPDALPVPSILLTAYIFFAAEILAAWHRRGWKAALTDRRLLLRRPEAPTLCDDIPIDTMTEAAWNRQNWELRVVSSGRDYGIFCFPWSARRILAALGRNDRAEAVG